MSPVFVFALSSLSHSLSPYPFRKAQPTQLMTSFCQQGRCFCDCVFVSFLLLLLLLRMLGRWCNLSFFQFSLFVFSCSCSVITTVTLFFVAKKKERQATLHNHQPRAVHSFGRQSWCAWCAAVVVRHHHQHWVALLWI